MEIRTIIAAGMLAFAATATAQTETKNRTTMEKLNLTQEWDKTFPQSDKVEHIKVTFTNRYGITLAADMYMPKNSEGRLPAIAVSGPFGAVKEQASGLYAQTLAERGFLAIAFDPSFTGESGGQPRFVTSPDFCTEDFSAAVDFLSTFDRVDPERIGILGICGWGGFAINAAVNDTRIKATVASTMYDMSRCTSKGYFDQADNADARNETRRQLSAQRTDDYRNGTYARAGGVVDPLPDDAPQFVKDYYAYYKTPRGYHKRSLNSNQGWNKTFEPAVPQRPDTYLQRRDTQRGACGSRRKGSLALYGRGRIQETEGRQQGTRHRSRREPRGPVRQHAGHTVRQDCRVLQQIP